MRLTGIGFVVRDEVPWVSCTLPRASNDLFSRCSFEVLAAEDPRAVRKRVDRVDNASFGGESEASSG
jgi:hypothetical protein